MNQQIACLQIMQRRQIILLCYLQILRRYLIAYQSDVTDRRVDEAKHIHQVFQQWWNHPDAIGTCPTLQNNALGQLTQKTDEKNQTSVYTYDNAGRMTQIVQTDAASNTMTINFTYDDAGNLKTYSDGTSSASYDYDNLNRKIAETVNYGTFSLTTGYSYNANGTKKSFTYPNGTAIEYSYDANNQIAGINIPDAGYISYGTYQWTRPQSITLPGGSTRLFNYDVLMRTTAVTGKDPGQNTLFNYSYGYDKMDNIKSRNTQDGNFAYNYDDLYRLNNVQKDANQTESYTYDQVGNRLTSITATDWTYDANNELLSYNGTSYQYDQNGNTIQKNINGQIQNYIYSVDNRLVEVQDASGNSIAKYTYDPFGRRISKTVGGTTTYFLYSDEGLIGEYDNAGNEIKTYGYKPNGTWSTDPLFMKQGTNYYFYYNDHLGTPQKMTDISGAIVWSATYDAFGKATVDAGSTVVNNLRFPGQYYDAETGLHYNRARYYDPKVGRFITKDPIGFKGGINLYVYVKNNAVNKVDPMGLVEWDTLLGCRHCEIGALLRCIGEATTPDAGSLLSCGACVLKCAASGPGFEVCLLTCQVECTRSIQPVLDTIDCFSEHCPGAYKTDGAPCGCKK